MINLAEETHRKESIFLLIKYRCYGVDPDSLRADCSDKTRSVNK